MIRFDSPFPAHDRAEAERVQLTYATLVGELLRDPETQQVFAGLRKQTGLGHKATALRFVQSLSPSTSVEKPLSDLSRIKRRIGSTLSGYVAKRMNRIMPLLATLLVDRFVQDVGKRGTGKPVARGEGLHSLVPRPELHYAPSAELSEKEERRLRKQTVRAYGEQMAQYSRTLRGKGRITRKKEESVKRNAAWFFRFVANGEKPQELGREYNQQQQAAGVSLSGDGHENVWRGINEAARLVDYPLPHRKN